MAAIGCGLGLPRPASLPYGTWPRMHVPFHRANTSTSWTNSEAGNGQITTTRRRPSQVRDLSRKGGGECRPRCRGSPRQRRSRANWPIPAQPTNCRGTVLNWQIEGIDQSSAIQHNALHEPHSETVMSDTESVLAEVVNVRKAPIGGKLLALVDVLIVIHGIEFKVRGLRVSREVMNGNHATSVTSPLHRDIDGQWSPTVTFPEELHQPLTDIVLAACIEAGVCREA